MVLDQFRIDGRIAFVTGSGRGIGQAIVRALAEAGAAVAVADVDLEVAEETASGIRSTGGRAIAVGTDVTRRDSVDAAVATAVAELGGPVDILVNNAGAIAPAMLHKMTFEQWSSVLQVHQNGCFNCLQSVVGPMMERGRGRVINLTSSVGLMGSLGQINYGTAKAGIAGFTRCAARELARYNVLVNAIAPVANTRMTQAVKENAAMYARSMERIPLRRWAEPEEIAPTAVFLASPASAFITGQVISVDGGSFMH
jgi:3-oxoacyl-[acyl-carrier protein] reductase